MLKKITNIFSRTPKEQEKPEEQDKPIQKRSFIAAAINHNNNDFVGSPSLNLDTQTSLKTIRDRARTLSLNNSYARRALELYKSSLIGADGIRVSVVAKNPDGSIDPICSVLESHYERWAEDPDVTGRFSLQKIEELLVEYLARDGEYLAIIRRGPQFGKYNIQLQVLDPDHLDESFNGTASNGNSIIQSVELNEFGAPVAYWIWKHNPSENSHQRNERIRFDASDVIHIFDTERASQQRGYSWFSPVMLQLQHLEKYREAAVVNARLSAAKSVFYTQTEKSDSFDDEDIDDQGNLSFEVTPGAHEILPAGWDVKPVDFNGGQERLPDFQKAILRGVAVGLGLSYNALSSDLESVNYSSARFGALQDESFYKSVQSLIIDRFLKRVYVAWLEIQLITNSWGLNIPFSKLDKFTEVQYQRPHFKSVDPLKDTNSDIALLDNNLASYSEILAKRGKTPEQVFAQIQQDRELMAKYGISKAELSKVLE